MNRHKAFSRFLRMGAVAGAIAILVSQPPPASSAVPAPLFQASPVIPVPNMRAYWPLDAATATITPDRSGSTPPNDGTLQPGATIDVANKAAVPVGNPASLAISGASNQIVTVPDSASLSLTGSFTLAAWIRPTLAAGGTQHGIIEKWDYTTLAVNGYNLRLSASNYLSFTTCGATTNLNISSAPRAISTNVWTHVAGTYDAGTGAMVMYIGGNPDATTGTFAGGPPGDGATELHIGGDYGSNRFGGNIDEARIYNRALTATEIPILRDGQPAPTMLAPAALAGINRLSWTPPPAAPAGITYSLLYGPSTGNYTGVINGINATTYDHAAPAGVPTYYRVVAVTVMASAPSTLEVSSTPGPAGPPPPPPPPPAPRTSQVGGEDNPCGCGTVSPSFGGLAALGLLLVLITMAPGLFRRG